MGISGRRKVLLYLELFQSQEGKEGNGMKARETLENIKKLDELIVAKKEELQKVRELAVNTVGNSDGMPHAPGVSDKVGNLVVKLVSLQDDLNALIARYTDELAFIVRLIETLSAEEYGVLHRYYIRRMTLEKIAEDMNYSRIQVWRIKERGIFALNMILNDTLKCGKMVL